MVRQEVLAPAGILLLMADGEEGTDRVRLLGRELEIRRINCRRNLQTVRDLIESHDGEFDAIGLEGFPLVLRLDQAQVNHTLTAFLRDAARVTPVVDGSGIRPGLERWGVVLAQRAEPGIFAEKRVLMMPGLNHVGLASSLARHGCQVRYADPVIFFDLPQFPGVARKATLEQAAEPILQTLRADPLERLFPPPDPRRGHGHHGLVEWADLLAGDAATIRCFSPADLRGKTVVVERASREDEMDLTARGASILVAMMPQLETDGARYSASAAAIEAAMVALRDHPDLSLSEDTYLDQIAGLDWSPRISYLQPGEADMNRFAFVIHPLSVRMIKAHPKFRWARALPDRLIEWFASYLPP
ncbi:MAG: serine carboxypeptidase, partial [Gammaproteobacteria bacterium]